MVAGVDFGDADFAQRVRDSVARVDDLIAAELSGADALMTEAVLHLFEAGGKRFRPLFTVLSAHVGPDPESRDVTVAGAVIEMVHLATLYHDDVMDEAQVRRGAPSANARWGNNIAILAGDYLFATASRLVAEIGPDAVRIIAETFALLVTGQMRETKGIPPGSDAVECRHNADSAVCFCEQEQRRSLLGLGQDGRSGGARADRHRRDRGGPYP